MATLFLGLPNCHRAMMWTPISSSRPCGSALLRPLLLLRTCDTLLLGSCCLAGTRRARDANSSVSFSSFAATCARRVRTIKLWFNANWSPINNGLRRDPTYLVWTKEDPAYRHVQISGEPAVAKAGRHKKDAKVQPFSSTRSQSL